MGMGPFQDWAISILEQGSVVMRRPAAWTYCFGMPINAGTKLKFN